MNGKTIVNSITISLVQAPIWIALLVLIFSGPLSAYLGQASTYFMIGAIISMGTIKLFQLMERVIWIPQSIPIAMLATTTTTITTSFVDQSSTDALFVTILAVIAISSLLTGIILYLLGRLKLGSLISKLPFAVMAGFLGGAGCLLLHGSIVTSVDGSVGTVSDLSENLIYWLPTVLLGLFLSRMEQRIQHVFVTTRHDGSNSFWLLRCHSHE
ncbi:MAG: SulP family inorganic anion transporter [Thiolinea sp.]